jgi:hypothetical protein
MMLRFDRFVLVIYSLTLSASLQFVLSDWNLLEQRLTKDGL